MSRQTTFTPRDATAVGAKVSRAARKQDIAQYAQQPPVLNHPVKAGAPEPVAALTTWRALRTLLTPSPLAALKRTLKKSSHGPSH
jgi:hypothetical protein